MMFESHLQYVYGIKIYGALVSFYRESSQLFKQYVKSTEGMGEKELDEKWEEFMYCEGEHIFPMFYDPYCFVDECFVIGFEVDSETFSDDGTLKTQIDKIFRDVVGYKPHDDDIAQVYTIEVE